MKELMKVNDSSKSVESGNGCDMEATARERVGRDGNGRSDIRESRQHVSFPIYERKREQLQIEVHSVVGLTFSSIRVPYDESIGDFVAKKKADMDTPTPVSNADTLTS